MTLALLGKQLNEKSNYSQLQLHQFHSFYAHESYAQLFPLKLWQTAPSVYEAKIPHTRDHLILVLVEEIE